MKYILLISIIYYIAFEPVSGARSGWAKTTRYWDCCKPSCAWRDNIKTWNNVPVASCNKQGWEWVDQSIQSGCNGGDAFMCNSHQPWIINDKLAYGFAAASFQGGVDTNMCCACFKLDFTDQLNGKSMIVQVTNTGGDLSANHFDLAIPGGGVGIFGQGCQKQWNAPSSGWGQQYGGVNSRRECYQLPGELQGGCFFRWDFMNGASNPGASFTQVLCPGEIIGKTGCNVDP